MSSVEDLAKGDWNHSNQTTRGKDGKRKKYYRYRDSMLEEASTYRFISRDIGRMRAEYLDLMWDELPANIQKGLIDNYYDKFRKNPNWYH